MKKKKITGYRITFANNIYIDLIDGDTTRTMMSEIQNNQNIKWVNLVSNESDLGLVNVTKILTIFPIFEGDEKAKSSKMEKT